MKKASQRTNSGVAAILGRGLIAVILMMAFVGVASAQAILTFPSPVSVTVAPGGTATTTVALTNVGNSMLLFWTVAGDDPSGDFPGVVTPSPNGGVNLAPGQSTNVTFTVNAAGAATGNYIRYFRVTMHGATTPSQVLTLNINVGATGAFNLSTTTLTFSPTDPGAKTFTATTTGATEINVSASSNVAWVSVTPSQGLTPRTFTVTAQPQSFNQTGTITVSSGATVQTVTVNWSTTGTSNLLTTNQPTVALSAQSGGASVSAGVVISSITGTAVNFSAAASATSGAWLGVTPASGSTVAGLNTITITASPAGLAAGTYAGTVVVTPTSPTGTALQIQVTFTVTSAPGITVDKTSLLFSSTGGAAVTPELITVNSTIGTATPYTITASAAWIVLNTTQGITPGAFTISANPALAPAGVVSAGTVTVTPTGGGTAATIDVRLARDVVAVAASPASLTLNASFGGTATAQFTLTSTGPTSFSLIASGVFGSFPWLSATAPGTGTSGFVQPGSPVLITVTANPSSVLAAGTYNGSVTVAPQSGAPITIPVTLNVGAGGGTGSLTAQPASVSLTTTTTSASVLVSSAVTGQSYFAYVTAGNNWLQVSPASGNLPATLLVIGSPAACGTSCTGSILVTSGAGTLTIPVTMNITGGGTGGLTVSPSTVTFSGTPGGGVQTSTISVFGATTTTFSATASTSTGAGWLQVVQSGFTTPGTVTIQANPSGLPAGTYSGTISITSTIGSASVPVTFTVTGVAGILTTSPAEVNFTTPVGTNPAAVAVTVSTSSGATVPFTVVTSGQGWLNVSPASGNTGTAISISANVSGLTAGIYLGTVTVDAGVNGKKDIPVVLNLGGTGGTLTVSPSPITFSVAADASGSTCQNVTVTGSSSGVSYLTTISEAARNWLSVPASGVTGSALNVCVLPSAAGVGTHSGTVVFNSTIGTAVVTVNLTVGGAGGGGTGTSGIVPSPASLAMSAPALSTTPVTQNLVLSPLSATSFSIFATSSLNWLSVTPNSGVAPTTVQVIANPSGLAAGSYNGSLIITTGLGTTTVPVTFTVGTGTGTGQFVVTPSSLTFTSSSGGTAPSQSVQVYSATGATTGFFASPSGAAWLTVSSSSAFTPAILTVNVNPAGLASGSYSGFINLTTLDGITQQTIPVTLTVSAAGLTINPASLTFTAPQGGTAPAQTVSVSSTTGIPQAVFPAATTSSGGSWLNVTPSSGNTPADFQVSVNAAGLQAGTYTGQVSFSTGVGAQNLAVTLTVTAPVTLSATPESLTFSVNQGASAPPAQNISVSSSGSNIGFTAAASGGTWLTISPTSGTTPATIAVTANPSGLAPGEYNGTVTITAPGASNSPRTVQVRLTVVPTAPQINSVANAASGATGLGAVSAGAIVTIKGRNLGPATGQSAQVVGNVVQTVLAEVRVFFGGVPSPILYAQEGQINAVVPFGIAGATSTAVVVEYRGQRSAAVTVPLTDASPGIFTADASGSGPGAILNQNYSLNTVNNAAEAGSFVLVYSTGAGLLQPIPADGAVVSGANLPQPMLPVSVLIGNLEARVTYAGQAPGLVAGAIQVNIQIPSGLAPGVYPVTLRVGRFSSQLGVTVAVR